MGIRADKCGQDEPAYPRVSVSSAVLCFEKLNRRHPQSTSTGMTNANDTYASDDVLLAFDAPAFVRRALAVEAAWNGLLERCRHERNRLLELPRIRLARFLK